tara:strand:+ start:278 stop:649 length:372 start_codon:yes stop_codon:yes gene_type:complete
MVISAVAKAAAKAIKIAKAKRALKPAKTRALKPRDRRVKKVSKTIKSVTRKNQIAKPIHTKKQLHFIEWNRKIKASNIRRSAFRALRKEQQKKEHLRTAQAKYEGWLAMRGYLWKFYGRNREG